MIGRIRAPVQAVRRLTKGKMNKQSHSKQVAVGPGTTIPIRDSEYKMIKSFRPPSATQSNEYQVHIPTIAANVNPSGDPAIENPSTEAVNESVEGFVKDNNETADGANKEIYANDRVGPEGPGSVGVEDNEMQAPSSMAIPVKSKPDVPPKPAKLHKT